MRILNLGWGIQSFTLAAMVALGELESIDAAIHADTTHERSATYAFAAKWTPWLEAHGVKIVTVRDADHNIINPSSMVVIPARTSSDAGGLMTRMCTAHWKIAPIRRWIQNQRRSAGKTMADLPKVIHMERVEQWLGISLDEAERMKPADVKYITHRWPLIEKRMSRNDCINWLLRHDLEVPVKSSCVFCPYHNRHAWFEMKAENGADWRKAVKVDEAIRKVRPPYDLFVYRDCIPLREIRSPQDNGQLEMFSEECTGYCFL